jgi:hypothetical protein
MGWAFSKHRVMKSEHKVLVSNLERNRQLPSRRLEYNIKIGTREIGSQDVDRFRLLQDRDQWEFLD